MIPRLTEVFLITEAGAGNIVRLLGFPQDVAEKLVSIDRKHAFAMAKIMDILAKSEQRPITGKYNPKTEWQPEQMENIWLEDDDMSLKFFLDIMKFAPNFAKEVASPAVKTNDDLQRARKKYEEAWGDSLNDAQNKILDVGDGWYWVLIDNSECSIEASRMQHCGQFESETVYSLRDPKGKPHITADIDGDTLLQMKGKQNDAPARKYWGMIKDLFNHLGVNKSVDYALQTDINDFMEFEEEVDSIQTYLVKVEEALEAMSSPAPMGIQAPPELRTMVGSAFDNRVPPEVFAEKWNKYWTEKYNVT